MTDLSETFYVGLYTFAGGFVLAVLALAYKSKCDQVKLCFGCLEVHRAVNIELQEDMRKVEFKDPEN
jgi:hypothetical protein